MTVSTEELRKLQCAECGDKDPDCNSLVLSPRCHMGKGVDVGCSGNHIHIDCFTCGLEVAVLEAPSAFIKDDVQFTGCHDKGVFAIYKKAAHTLDFQCVVCKKIVGSLALPALN